MTENEAQAIAKHYENPLTECWKRAFDDYAQNYTTTRHIHSPRSRASLLHDHCVHHIQLLCIDHQFISFPPRKQGLFTIHLSGEPLGIEGALVGRFKKFNERLLTSNIQTEQVKNFNNQMPLYTQGDLFGFPLVETEPPHVNIGYLPDRFWSSFEAVYVTMPNGRHSLSWVLRLTDDRTASIPIIEMPITPATTTARRVTAKVGTVLDKKVDSKK